MIIGSDSPEELTHYQFCLTVDTLCQACLPMKLRYNEYQDRILYLMSNSITDAQATGMPLQ